eukprot:s149_g3.t4
MEEAKEPGVRGESSSEFFKDCHTVSIALLNAADWAASEQACEAQSVPKMAVVSALGASTPGARGVDVSLAATGGKRWWTGVGLGGKLYGLPCNTEHLLIFDPSCFTEPITFVDTRSVAKGEGKWRSAVALGGKLYGIPDRAEAMLIYDFVSKQITGIDTRKVAKGPLKWQSAVSLPGKVYGIPLNAEKLLVFDPKVHDTSAASRPKSSPLKSDGLSGLETGHIATGKLKWLAGLSLGGKVIGVPCHSDALLVYDPLSNSSVGVPTNYHATGPFKWLCAVAFQGMLYAIPCHADCILIYDPSNNRLSHVDTRAVATGPGKWLSCVVVAQKIYGIPDRASKVLVFDPATEEVSGIDVSRICDGTAKWQSAAVLGGRIYAVPYHAHDILVVDPVTSTASSIDIRSLGTGNGKWGFGTVLGGALCGLPWDSPKILVYQPAEAKEETSPMAAKPSAEKVVDMDVESSDPVEHGYNGTPDISSKLGSALMQDFVGAWLSEWIYFADPAKPYAVPTMKVDGSPVKFQVHSVMDDPLLGSPARSAVVTAVLPGSSVVYLVFKGSSFMNDFVANASVSPDYTPFDATFQDRTTFIHHGAYHATAQLRVQQWPALQEQLERCVQDGVKQMIITGHSLGGQYALAFMLQVFLDGVKGTTLHPLLQEARCAAFGAPMCYGAAEGSDIRQDLATFIHARTAVYINAGDPAPRLWSELDLEDFMRYAIRWFQGKVSSFSMRILDYAAGGLAQKAQEILKRPDIEKHLLRPAARYVHLSQIRVLAKVKILLPSGRAESILVAESSKVGDLRVLAQKVFQQGFLKLVTAEGHVLSDPSQSLSAAGIQEGDHLMAIAQQAGLEGTTKAVAIWCYGGNKILTWGHPDYGADRFATVKSVQQVQATERAFAAILGDGSVVTWGHQDYGGDSTAVRDQLNEVQHVQATSRAFAAILADGSAVTWGNPDFGGDSSKVQNQLKDVQQVQSSAGAFAAILTNGSVVSWGHPRRGGNSTGVQNWLRSVQQIQATIGAFAAILADGSVVTWGHPGYGGDSSAVRDQLHEVQHVQATSKAFAAILADGSIVTWGHPDFGGDKSKVPSHVKNVQQLKCTERAFAVILSDGTVVTWGDPRYGGDSSEVQGQLRNVKQLEATEFAFAAILADRSVVSWGYPSFGGDHSEVQDGLRNVRQIYGAKYAFVAVLDDGSVVTWGDPLYGGDCSEIHSQLKEL